MSITYLNVSRHLGLQLLSLLVQLMDSVAVKKSQNRKWTQVVGPLSHKKHAGLLPTPRRHISGRALVTQECTVELVTGIMTMALRCGAPEWGQRPPITGIVPAVSHTSLLRASVSPSFAQRERIQIEEQIRRAGGWRLSEIWGFRARVDVTFTGVV